MKIQGKNIILTGASSGIGKELLDILVSYQGVKIIAIARHVDNIPAIEDKVYPFAADMSTQEGVDKAFSFSQQTFGDTDIFIANAGFAYLEKLDKPDWEHIQHIFSLNVFSSIYSLEKLMQESHKEKAFVCTISGAGLVSLPAYSLYCSTKAALHHFVKTYRYENPDNLQITAVYPVATRTEFFDKAASDKNVPLPWPQQDAQTVAKKVVKGIEKGKKHVFPSTLFRIFYPVGRAFPFLQNLYSLTEKKKVKNRL